MSKVVGIDMVDYSKETIFDKYSFKSDYKCLNCNKITGRLIRVSCTWIKIQSIGQLCEKCFNKFVREIWVDKDWTKLGDNPPYKIKNVKVVYLNE